MKRYFIYLGYDGGAYHGWQIQPGDISVQQCLEEALATLLRRPTPVVGAGRTDAGVNARLMVAHADMPEEIVERDKARFIRSLNSLTPRDIAIYDIVEVAPDAHARFDAKRRTYRYFVHHGCDPFLRHYSLNIAPLDYSAMNEAAEQLLDVDDFTSFAKLHTDNKTNICHVDTARWIDISDNDSPLAIMRGNQHVGMHPGASALSEAERSDEFLVNTSRLSTGMGQPGGRYYFEISADRFLRNMVRAVVGTIVEVGRGKMTLSQFRDVIARRNRCDAGTSMPPHPLFLWNIEY